MIHLKTIHKILVLSASLLLLSVILYAQNYQSRSTLPEKKSVMMDNKGKNNTANNSRIANVIIVYKTHFDIGYSGRAQEVIHSYRTAMADRLLDVIEKNSHQPKENQFVWTLSGWPMKQILWEGQAPERKDKIEQAIRNGNIVVHAFPFSMHTETSDLEDMVRGLNISSVLNRKYGQPLSVSAKMSDVPGGSWILPTLFNHAGIKFYHMGGPVVNRELGLPSIFWWEGPDGSRVLTLYNNSYGTDPLPPANWPFKTWIYINMTGDNEGPPSPETVKKDLDFYQSLGIKARVGNMDDFTELIMKEDLSYLPIVRSDVGDVWIHGSMSMPEASKLAQNIRPSIGGLEQLSTLESVWGIYGPDLRLTIAKAYEQSLLYSEHTWGLANQHYVKVPYGEEWYKLWRNGLPPQFRLMEASWKDHADYINNVERLIATPFEEAVTLLADNINTDKKRIIVYNPLPWKRSGEVILDTRLVFGSDFISVKPLDGGDVVAVSHEYPAIEDKAPMSRFFVMDIPAMGYRTFVASNENVSEPELLANKKTGVIESPFFKAKLDTVNGCIASLIDKRTGYEMVDKNAPQGFGQYFYERFGYKQLANWIDKSLYSNYKAHRFAFVAYDMPHETVYHSVSPKNMTLDVIKSPIDVKAVMSGTIYGPGIPQKITISLTLSGYSPTADIEVSWQKDPDSWPEAAWISLPFNSRNPRFRLGRLGADVDPETDMVVDNANYHLFWVNYGVAVYDSITGAGYGICSPDAPLVSLGEPGEYKFDKRYLAKKPYIYLNLYNNHWRTNFPAWIGNGQRMEARVRIWSFNNYNTESSLFTPAMETRVPLKAAFSEVKNGNLPVTQSGIILSRKGVALTAFGPNPDGDGLILRLWEQAGISGACTVIFPEGMNIDIIQPVDLRGSIIGNPMEVTNGKFTFDLAAYSPASFVIPFIF